MLKLFACTRLLLVFQSGLWICRDIWDDTLGKFPRLQIFQTPIALNLSVCLGALLHLPQRQACISHAPTSQTYSASKPLISHFSLLSQAQVGGPSRKLTVLNRLCPFRNLRSGRSSRPISLCIQICPHQTNASQSWTLYRYWIQPLSIRSG